MQNLNESGSDRLATNVELMDLTYDVDAAVLGHSQDILRLVENYVSKN